VLTIMVPLLGLGPGYLIQKSFIYSKLRRNPASQTMHVYMNSKRPACVTFGNVTKFAVIFCHLVLLQSVCNANTVGFKFTQLFRFLYLNNLILLLHEVYNYYNYDV